MPSFARRRSASISVPIIVASVTVALSIALLIGWTLLIFRSWTATTGSATPSNASHWWLLIAGILSFCLIMAALIILAIFLVREILEVRRQDTFIDSVTHELKSPLASLKLCLQTLMRPDITPDQAQTLRQMMFDDVERLATFIDDVLEASRVTTKKRSYTLSLVPLAEHAHACAKQIETRYHLASGTIALEVESQLTVHTDATAVDTILLNLLDNAVKYSKPNEPPQVVVVASGPALSSEQASVAVSGKRPVCIEVQDRGIGIPTKFHKRLVDRFFRVPSEAVRSRRGTGLGLFVVKNLVRNLGGELTIHSQPQGTGTIMRVCFPSAPAPAPHGGQG